MPLIRQNRNNVRRHLALLAKLIGCVALAACATRSPAPADHASPLAGAGQLVLVSSADWDATRGTLRRFERDGARWREVGSATAVMLGRSGAAWGTGLHARGSGHGPVKREGDGRAPAGAYRIGTAFGYTGAAATSLPYAAMEAGHWCIDVADSPLYNRIVHVRDVGQEAVTGSTEPMRRDLHADGDMRYALGFVIEHNPSSTPGAGSCIFAHLWREPGETTAGCTAMAEHSMRELLSWLDVRRAPVFVLLPETELRRLAATWDLPHAPTR